MAFHVELWEWATFGGIVVGLLLLGLLVAQKRPHAPAHFVTISIGVSLGVIAAVLAASVVWSLQTTAD